MIRQKNGSIIECVFCDGTPDYAVTLKSGSGYLVCISCLYKKIDPKEIAERRSVYDWLETYAKGYYIDD